MRPEFNDRTDTDSAQLQCKLIEFNGTVFLCAFLSHLRIYYKLKLGEWHSIKLIKGKFIAIFVQFCHWKNNVWSAVESIKYGTSASIYKLFSIMQLFGWKKISIYTYLKQHRETFNFPKWTLMYRLKWRCIICASHHIAYCFPKHNFVCSVTPNMDCLYSQMSAELVLRAHTFAPTT